MRQRPLSENGAILALLAAFVLAKLPSLTTPFWWDEAGAYIPPSLAVAKRGLWVALPGGHPRGLLHGHPPVLYLLHGGLYQLLGNSIVPHRVASVAFALIGLWFTYRLGLLLSGRSTGVCAAILLACSPMFFAQSSMVLGDMPIASLGVMSVYYLFAGKWQAYTIAATLLVQTKETALAIPVAAALYHVFFPPTEIGKWRRFLIHAVPIGSLAAFFGIEYLSTGTFVQAPFFNSGPFFIFDLRDPVGAARAILEQTQWVARVLFFGEGRFVLTGLLVLGVLHWRKFCRPQFTVFGLVIAFYWAAFSLIGFLPRYVMPALPFLCVAGSWSVYVVVRSRKVTQYAVVCIAALIFVPFFYTASESGDFETNMEHMKAVAVCERLGEYVEANFSGARVAADWPIAVYLRVPELGYVNTPRPVVVTDALDPDKPISPKVFVYFSIGPSSRSSSLVARATGPPLRRFEEDGIFAEVYELSSSAGR